MVALAVRAVAGLEAVDPRREAPTVDFVAVLLTVVVFFGTVDVTPAVIKIELINDFNWKAIRSKGIELSANEGVLNRNFITIYTYFHCLVVCERSLMKLVSFP